MPWIRCGWLVNTIVGAGVDRRMGRLHRPRRHHGDVFRAQMEIWDDDVGDSRRGGHVFNKLGHEVGIGSRAITRRPSVDVEHAIRRTRLHFIVRRHPVDTEEGDSGPTRCDDPRGPG